MTDLSNEATAAEPATEPVIDSVPTGDSTPETEAEDDWSTTWVCTQPDGWSQHDGDRFEITASGAVIFYMDDEVTGVANLYEDIFRKDLVPLEWLYKMEIEKRPVPELRAQTFGISVDLDKITGSSVHPTDADGFYSVTDCLPESLIIIDEHDPYVTMKYADGTVESGIYLVAKKEFKRSHFSFAKNLAFSKTKKEVVGWKYRS